MRNRCQLGSFYQERQFPNSIWAGIAGFQPDNAYFATSEGAKTAPVVKFN